MKLDAKIEAVLAGESDGAIVRGDALAVLETIPDGCIDAIITDPPYSSGGQFRGDRMVRTSDKYVRTDTVKRRPDFGGDNRDQRSFGYWSALWLSQALRISKGGAMVCVFSDWRQLPTTTDAIQSGGWIWRGVAVWDKSEAARPVKGRFRNQAEYIVWGTNGPRAIPADAPPLAGVFRHVVRQADKFHIAGKPTPLMEDILRVVAPGELIIDPFAGSGTTLVAAKRRGCRYIGVEGVDRWYEKARGRLRDTEGPLFDTPGAEGGS